MYLLTETEDEDEDDPEVEPYTVTPLTVAEDNTTQLFIFILDKTLANV